MRGPYKRKKAVKAPKEIYKLSDEEELPKDFPSGAFPCRFVKHLLHPI